MLKKSAKHKVKSYFSLCKSVFAWETKNEAKNVNKNSIFSSIFVIIFYLLTTITWKIAWWTLVFRHNFYIFFYNEKLRKIYRSFINKFLFYHTSLEQDNFSTQPDKIRKSEIFTTFEKIQCLFINSLKFEETKSI